MRLICQAWKRVKVETIENCFHSAGWRADLVNRQRTPSTIGIENAQTSSELRDPSTSISKETPPSINEEVNTQICSIQRNMQAIVNHPLSRLTIEFPRENDLCTEPVRLDDSSFVKGVLGLSDQMDSHATPNVNPETESTDQESNLANRITSSSAETSSTLSLSGLNPHNLKESDLKGMTSFLRRVGREYLPDSTERAMFLQILTHLEECTKRAPKKLVQTRLTYKPLSPKQEASQKDSGT